MMASVIIDPLGIVDNQANSFAAQPAIIAGFSHHAKSVAGVPTYS